MVADGPLRGGGGENRGFHGKGIRLGLKKRGEEGGVGKGVKSRGPPNH